MAEADSGNLYPVDLLANAVLHRSINLVRGFAAMVERRNFTCAAALLRLQIDNCLRFYAVFLVDQPHDFAMEVFKGTQVRKLRDKSGALMTDAYLLRRLSEAHPWMPRVYERTSGYVHLSAAHIFNTFSPRSPQDEEETTQTISIGAGDNFEDEALYEEAASAFVETTQVLFKYVVGWVATKQSKPSSAGKAS